jgi:hypothetical protein
MNLIRQQRRRSLKIAGVFDTVNSLSPVLLIPVINIHLLISPQISEKIKTLLRLFKMFIGSKQDILQYFLRRRTVRALLYTN